MPHARNIDTAFWIWKTWNSPGHKNTGMWDDLARYRLSPGWHRLSSLATKEAEFIDANGQATPAAVEETYKVLSNLVDRLEQLAS